ncbi:MAG: hypothetical protein GQ534_04345, partial [Candidatus Delongbacteria bacterium]|nr:hypothetical protein [Candidatus Delongbacteria bacterium]
YIGILGNPTLQNVKYFNVGIIDSAGTIGLDSEIWLDELRLVKVKKDPGMAMRAKARIEIADIAIIDADIIRQDGNFHRIEEKSGGGVTSQNFNLNTTFHLDKLVPQKLGLKIPVKYTYSNKDSYTKYQGSTDILVDENNVPDSVRKKSVSNKYNFSVKKTSKSNNPFIKHTLDKLSFSGDATFSNSSDATYLSSETETYRYTVGYSLSLPESWFSFKPFGWVGANSFMKNMKDFKFAFFPSSYTTGLTTNKNQTLSMSRKGNYTKSQLFNVSRTLSTSINQIPKILSSTYNLTLESNMYKTKVDLDSLPGQDSIVVIDSYEKDFSDLAMFDFGELSSLKSKTTNSLKLHFSNSGRMISLLILRIVGLVIYQVANHQIA